MSAAFRAWGAGCPPGGQQRSPRGSGRVRAGREKPREAAGHPPTPPGRPRRPLERGCHLPGPGGRSGACPRPSPPAPGPAAAGGAEPGRAVRGRGARPRHVGGGGGNGGGDGGGAAAEEAAVECGGGGAVRAGAGGGQRVGPGGVPGAAGPAAHERGAARRLPGAQVHVRRAAAAAGTRERALRRSGAAPRRHPRVKTLL